MFESPVNKIFLSANHLKKQIKEAHESNEVWRHQRW